VDANGFVCTQMLEIYLHDKCLDTSKASYKACEDVGAMHRKDGPAPALISW